MLVLAIAVRLLCAGTPSLGVDAVHPAFKLDAAQYQKSFVLGKSKCKDFKEISQPLDIVRKGIGDIRVSALRHKTVSFLWFQYPLAVAFQAGVESGKKYWSEGEEKAWMDRFVKSPLSNPEILVFEGLLNLLPSFGGGYGKIDRLPNPDELKGVRVVLKIGKRVVYPVMQPGDLKDSGGIAINSVLIPQTQTSTTSTSASGSISGPGGSAVVQGSGTSVTTNYYSVKQEQEYSWYQGRFLVGFMLKDDNGKPILTPEDKEFTVVVIYGHNEREAKFKLSDLDQFSK